MILRLLLLLGVGVATVFAHKHSHNNTCGVDCLDLYSVDTLTFTRDEYSEGSDGSVYPQLTCNGGNACSESSDIAAIDCINGGVGDDETVVWNCLPQDTYQTLYISNIDVMCDGYRYPGDPEYVYANSCRLMFNLDDSVYDNKNDDDLGTDDDKIEVENTTYIGRLLIVIFAFIFMAIVCTCCNKDWGHYYPKSYRATQMYEYIDEPILSPIDSYQGMPVVHNTLIQPPDTRYGSYQQQQQAWTGPGWYGGGVEIIDIKSGVGSAGSKAIVCIILSDLIVLCRLE